jgi:hypothetical protein
VELEFREVPAVDEEARRFIERSLLRPAAGRSSRA